MPSPTQETFLKTAKRFNNPWNFPNYIGSIDGKNIIIKCPPNSGSRYFNYKHYRSIVLKAVVDSNLKFLTVDIRAYGKQSDDDIRNSRLYQSLETRSLKLPKYTVLPRSKIILPYFCW
jgi:hypothetical protein